MLHRSPLNCVFDLICLDQVKCFVVSRLIPLFLTVKICQEQWDKSETTSKHKININIQNINKLKMEPVRIRQCQCYLTELCRYCRNIPKVGECYCWRHSDGQCAARTPRGVPKCSQVKSKVKTPRSKVKTPRSKVKTPKVKTPKVKTPIIPEEDIILSPRQLKRAPSRNIKIEREQSSLIFGRDIDLITPTDLFWLVIDTAMKDQALPTSSNVIAILNEGLSGIPNDVKANFAKKFLQGGKIVEQQILNEIQNANLPVDELARTVVQDIMSGGKSRYDRFIANPSMDLPEPIEWARRNAELLDDPEQLAINQDPDQSISVDEIYKQITPPGFLHPSIRRAASLVK